MDEVLINIVSKEIDLHKNTTNACISYAMLIACALATLRLDEKNFDIIISVPYSPSKDITVNNPLKYLTVGRCNVRSNAMYLLGVVGVEGMGPRRVNAIDRVT